MKLKHRVERPELPSEATLFEPWERLLLVSVELDDAPPALRDLAAACFACIRHMAGRTTRDEAYRAVRRALYAVRDARGGAPLSEGSPPSPSDASPIQHRLPIDDGMTIRVSRETHEALTQYARERGMEFESAVERMVRIAVRRRAAVGKWNRKSAAAAE